MLKSSRKRRPQPAASRSTLQAGNIARHAPKFESNRSNRGDALEAWKRLPQCKTQRLAEIFHRAPSTKRNSFQRNATHIEGAGGGSSPQLKHGHLLLIAAHLRPRRARTASLPSSPSASRTAAEIRSCEPNSLFSASSREAKFTVSPMTVYSLRRGEPILPATTSPKWMPMPILSGQLVWRVDALHRGQHLACRGDRAVRGIGGL